MIDFSAPLAGLDRASAQLDQAASRIAQAPVAGDTADLSGDAVALIQARLLFQANVKAMQVQDQVAKSLLNLIG